ncbi:MULTISPECIES: hypothetical protein [Agathobaculum]|uniref:hypothetical protein n=1 Tax=Agathobaculum TaxID=2048137 RepID=UPI003F8E9482
MDNRNNWNRLKNIKAPDELKERTLAAARQARREEQQNTPQHLAAAPRRRFGMAKRIVAVACAFGVVVGGTAVWKSQQSGQPASDAVAEAVAHSFGIVAYAAETGEVLEPKNSKIVFDDGAGVDDPEKGFFSGCLFKVTGENIQSVSASMDKGGLYRTKTLTGFDVDAYYQMTAAAEEALRAGKSSAVAAAEAASDPRLEGADEVMSYGLGETENASEIDACWKLENGFVDDYDPEVSYGFWGEPKPYDPNADLREAWHGRIDEFDGAVLTVTVTFTDGTTDTQTLTLHTGKLGVTYPDDGSGMRLTGEVLTDEQAAEQGYVYGVYAEIA